MLGPLHQHDHHAVPLSAPHSPSLSFPGPSCDIPLARIIVDQERGWRERTERSVLASFPAVFYAATTTTAIPSRPPPPRGPNTFELVVSLTRLVARRRAQRACYLTDTSDTKAQNQSEKNRVVPCARPVFNIFPIARNNPRRVTTLRKNRLKSSGSSIPLNVIDTVNG